MLHDRKCSHLALAPSSRVLRSSAPAPDGSLPAGAFTALPTRQPTCPANPKNTPPSAHPAVYLPCQVSCPARLHIIVTRHAPYHTPSLTSPCILTPTRCGANKPPFACYYRYHLQSYFDAIYGGDAALRAFHAEVNGDPQAAVGDWEGGARTVQFVLPVNVPAMLKKVIGERV